MTSEGDLFIVLVPFYGLEKGSHGVCIHTYVGKNLVSKMDILMQNGNIATLTEREIRLFLKNVGAINVVDKAEEELIDQLKQLNQQPKT